MFKLAWQLFRCCSFWICDDFSICRALYSPRGKSKSFRITDTISTQREPSSRTSSIRDRCLVAGWHDDNVGKCRVLCRVLMIMTWHRELLLIHNFLRQGSTDDETGTWIWIWTWHKQQQEARRDCHVQQKLVVSFWANGWGAILSSQKIRQLSIFNLKDSFSAALDDKFCSFQLFFFCSRLSTNWRRRRFCCFLIVLLVAVGCRN